MSCALVTLHCVAGGGGGATLAVAQLVSCLVGELRWPKRTTILPGRLLSHPATRGTRQRRKAGRPG